MDRCGVMVIVERLFLLSLVCELVESWSNEELALYDLVEEVNSNFYELFSVKQVGYFLLPTLEVLFFLIVSK